MLNGLDLSGYLSIIGYARQTTEGNKMSNYPEGSMRGSGIYSYQTTTNLICEAELENGTYCDFDDEVDANVNDWGTMSATCPKCGHEHEELGSVNDPDNDPANEYEPDRFMD